MTTKPVILSQKKGGTAEILLPHTSADLTGYTNETVPEVKEVKKALDVLFERTPPDVEELTAKVESLESTQQMLAKKNHADAATEYGMGTDALYGHVKLSDATDSSNLTAATGGTAATPKAVADAMTAAKQWTADKPDIVKRMEAVEAEIKKFPYCPAKNDHSNKEGTVRGLWGGFEDGYMELPEGGTYFYHAVFQNEEGKLVALRTNVAAGGTKIKDQASESGYADVTKGWGFYWRVR